MKRGYVTLCFTVLALKPVMCQQAPGLEGIRGPVPIGLPGRTAPDSSATNPKPFASTPKWSSSFVYTPDTALIGHSAVYDPAANIMTLFGGANWGAEFTYTNAVLLYAPANGSGTFTTLVPNGAAGSPIARAAHSAVYDSASNRMIVFGGGLEDGEALGDTWVLTNANGQGGPAAWTQLIPAGTTPGPRYAHQAVYDSKNNRMIVYAGYNSTAALSDVWVLSHANGLGGTPAWAQITPGGIPPNGLVYASAVYDLRDNTMIVFGGENAGRTAYSNGVWTLSHANGLGGSPQWSNVVAEGAPGSPSQRAVAAAVYDAPNNRMILFGGEKFTAPLGTDLNDVWVLANANGLSGTPAWTQLKPASALPGSRIGHTAVYNASTNQMIVFAGQNTEAVYYVVWVLSHANGL